MAQITREELLKLAQISHINVSDSDADKLVKEIAEILQYASFLQEVAKNKNPEYMPQNINIMRDDFVAKTDPEPLLANAPERQENFFVVPVILKQ